MSEAATGVRISISQTRNGPSLLTLTFRCTGEFLGYWAVMNSAVFSFAGVESVAMAAAETRNPRQAIPKACKRVFWRVVSEVFDVLVLQWLLSAGSFDRTGRHILRPSTAS